MCHHIVQVGLFEAHFWLEQYMVSRKLTGKSGFSAFVLVLSLFQKHMAKVVSQLQFAASIFTVSKSYQGMLCQAGIEGLQAANEFLFSLANVRAYLWEKTHTSSSVVMWLQCLGPH